MISLSPTAERSPESALLPPHSVLVLLPDPRHLLPVVHAHPRLAVHPLLPRARGRRPLPARSPGLACALSVHKRLRVVRVLLQRTRSVRPRRPVGRDGRLPAVRIRIRAIATACAPRRCVGVWSNQSTVALRAGLCLALASALRGQGLNTDVLARATTRGVVWTAGALDVCGRWCQNAWGCW